MESSWKLATLLLCGLMLEPTTAHPFLTATRTKKTSTQTRPTTAPASGSLKIWSGPEVVGYPGLYESVALECVFHGSQAARVTWIKDSLPLSKIDVMERMLVDGDVPVESNDSDSVVSTRARLYLYCLTPLEQGVYSCGGYTPFDVVGRSRELLVDDSVWDEENAADCERFKGLPLLPARVIQWNSHILAKIGTDVRMHCKVEGFPKPDITWTNNTSPITNASPRARVMEDGSLVIDQIQWTDMGQYKCSTSNELSTDETTTFLYPYKA